MENIAIEKTSDKKTTKLVGETTSEDVQALRGMANQAAENDGVSRPFMEPKTKTEGQKKETRGRKSNAEKAKIEAEKTQTTTPPPPGLAGYEVAKPTFEAISHIVVRVTGVKNAGLLPEELEQLAKTWGMVLDRRLPFIIANYGDIIAASGVTLVVCHRVQKELDAEIKRRQALKKEQEQGPAERPVTETETRSAMNGVHV